MQNNVPKYLELICVIANYGLGKKIEKFAKSNGAKYSSCTYGTGTASTGLIDLMGLADVRKEVIYLVSDSENADVLLNKIDEKFKFYKPNHGIAFTIPIMSAILCKSGMTFENNLEEEDMSDLITVIVDKGKAEDVISYASKAGAKGGTILNARGSAGDLPCQKIFAMEIEPEKEIVIIISEAGKTDAIVNSIDENMNLSEPNSGILFVQPVKRTIGIQK